MDGMVLELLDLSRLEAGRVKRSRSEVSLEKLTLYFWFNIMDTVAWETPAARATSVEVTFFFGIG